MLGYHADEAAAGAAAARLQALGGTALAVRADVGEIGGCAALVRAAGEAGGGPLSIVHSAASIYPTALLEADLARFKRAVPKKEPLLVQQPVSITSD